MSEDIERELQLNKELNLDELDIDNESENDDYVGTHSSKKQIQKQPSFEFGEQKISLGSFEMHLTNSNPVEACNLFVSTLATIQNLLPTKPLPSYLQ